MPIQPVTSLTDSPDERPAFTSARVNLRSPTSNCYNAILYFDKKTTGVESPLYISRDMPEADAKTAADNLGKYCSYRGEVNIPALIREDTLPLKKFIHGWIDKQEQKGLFPNGITYRLRMVSENLGNGRTTGKLILDLCDKKGDTYTPLSINIPGLEDNTGLRHYCEKIVEARLGSDNRITRHSDSPRVRRERGSDVTLTAVPDGISLLKQNGTRSYAVLLRRNNMPVISVPLGIVTPDEAERRYRAVSSFVTGEIEGRQHVSLSAITAYAAILGQHHGNGTEDHHGHNGNGHEGLNGNGNGNGSILYEKYRTPRLRHNAPEVRYPNTGGLMFYAPAIRDDSLAPLCKAYVNHTGNAADGYRYNISIVPPDGNQRTHPWTECHFQIPPSCGLDDKKAAELLFNLREYVYARLGNYFITGHKPELYQNGSGMRCTREGRIEIDAELEHRLNAKFVCNALSAGIDNPFSQHLPITDLANHGASMRYRNCDAWANLLAPAQIEWPQPTNQHLHFHNVTEQVMDKQLFYEFEVELRAHDGIAERSYSRTCRIPHRDAMVTLAQHLNASFPAGEECAFWEAGRRLEQLLAHMPRLQVIPPRISAASGA